MRSLVERTRSRRATIRAVASGARRREPAGCRLGRVAAASEEALRGAWAELGPWRELERVAERERWRARERARVWERWRARERKRGLRERAGRVRLDQELAGLRERERAERAEVLGLRERRVGRRV